MTESVAKINEATAKSLADRTLPAYVNSANEYFTYTDTAEDNLDGSLFTFRKMSDVQNADTSEYYLTGGTYLVRNKRMFPR